VGDLRTELQVYFNSEIKKNKGKSQIFKKFSDGVMRFEFEGGGVIKLKRTVIDFQDDDQYEIKKKI
jgi:hypothetical protein